MTQSEAQATLAALENAEVSADSLGDLAEILLNLARQKKALEAEKADKADPLHSQWKKVLAPISKRLKAVEEALDEGKAKYLQCLEARDAELQTAVNEGRFLDAESLTDEPGSITIARVKEVLITGPLDQEYTMPDLDKIKNALKAGQDVRNAALVEKKVVRCEA